MKLLCPVFHNISGIFFVLTFPQCNSKSSQNKSHIANRQTAFQNPLLSYSSTILVFPACTQLALTQISLDYNWSRFPFLAGKESAFIFCRSTDVRQQHSLSWFLVGQRCQQWTQRSFDVCHTGHTGYTGYTGYMEGTVGHSVVLLWKEHNITLLKPVVLIIIGSFIYYAMGKENDFSGT